MDNTLYNEHNLPKSMTNIASGVYSDLLTVCLGFTVALLKFYRHFMTLLPMLVIYKIW